ncbi:hypothetical protein GI374_16650 [Paracoccus sp. S-4012]|uniref:TRAP transporter substrate-binding protein DctP n=1 Tax=Paracoccus sp. S-4012 TaxID=2665648 RepID=UPI0012AF7C12|nr:TRAP transporter substrate-binding protein DctP [Paracoccus sp. S-4012]MRX52010.1 hypothetical protein [Paracoccus sp. S-4012]
MNALTKTLAAAAMLLGSTAIAQAQEVVLKAVTYVHPTKVEDAVAIFNAWIDRVNEKAEGRMKIEVIGGPEVFPVNDQVKAVSRGLADITLTFTSHAPMVPEINSIGVSQITPAEERENGYLQLLDEAHNKIGIKVIGRTATDSGFYIFSKEPIDSLSDFQNVKIRSHSGYDDFFRALGANPIGMAISEIYGGLERSVVTAAPYNMFVYDLGIHEVVKYALADSFWPSHTTVTLMNLKKFEGLDPELQQILIDSQIEIEAEMEQIGGEMIAAERKRLEEAGMTFTNLPPEEAVEFRRLAAESRFDVLEEEIGPERTAQIRELITRD